MNRIAFIEYARGYAILSIVLYHYLVGYDLGKWLNLSVFFGGTGIHLFFFLSGFGLNLSKSIKLEGYFSKRFLKVYFPYFLIVTLIYTSSTFIALYPDANVNVYLSHILLYKMFFHEYINSLGGHFWFISTIIQFYIVFPLLRRLQQVLGNNLFLVLSVIVSLIHLLLTIYFSLYARHISSIFTLYLWEFALGMYLAKAYQKDGVKFWDGSIWKFAALFLFSITVMGVLTLRLNEVGVVLNDFAAFFAYTSFCIISYHLISKSIAPVGNWIISVGKYSYSLYLIHMLVLHLVEKSFRTISFDYPLFYLPLIFVLTLFLAAKYEQITTILTNLLSTRVRIFSRQ
ncbi:acyltransferase family protein [Tunicatimonas pelagia]|uniref:acyltransferase family protein n=1 Tax=Tunicatimonas pelagia TaxID=931531 RepID=UPI00345DBDD6